MNIPAWKKWLSYLTPLTLEHAGSEQNPVLTVTLSRGRLQLLSGNAIYSWDDLYNNFTNAFPHLDLDNRHIENVLVLGLGLGSVPFILEKVFGKKYHYTLVEWDETVAALADKYTLVRLESSVEVVVADAEVFVEVCEDRFDMVVIDLFEDDLTPPPFEEVDFLRGCDRLLNPGGLLLYNRLYFNDANRHLTKRFFERKFKATFPEGWRLDTGGNWILCHEKGHKA